MPSSSPGFPGVCWGNGVFRGVLFGLLHSLRHGRGSGPGAGLNPPQTRHSSYPSTRRLPQQVNPPH